MFDLLVQGIKWLMELWGLLPEKFKEDLKTQAADKFDGAYRNYFRAATGEAKQA